MAQLIDGDPGWAELVARVHTEKAQIEVSPPPPAPVAEEAEPEQKAEEMTPQEQREWNERLMQAGRYLKGKRGVWGIERHIYHKIPQPLDRTADRHMDKRVVGNHRTHFIRRPVDKRIHRGVGRIKGVNPFHRGR